MGEQTSIGILSVNGHPLVREGMAQDHSTRQSDMSLAAAASSASDGIRKYRKHLPEIVLSKRYSSSGSVRKRGAAAGLV